MGDINGDYEVTIIDIVNIALAFGTEPGDEEWNSNADFDNNDIINILDIVNAALNFGLEI